MSNARKEYAKTVMSDRVAKRFAMEFPTEEAKKEYMKQHPDADPANHSVKAPSTKPAKPKKLTKRNIKELGVAAREWGGKALGTDIHNIKDWDKFEKDGLITVHNSFCYITPKGRKALNDEQY